jgi:hypothetical protein
MRSRASTLTLSVTPFNLETFLSAGPVEVPPSLRETYPEPQQIAKKPEDLRPCRLN